MADVRGHETSGRFHRDAAPGPPDGKSSNVSCDTFVAQAHELKDAFCVHVADRST